MFKTFVSEVRRRNVLPTLLPYVGLVWLLLQVVSVIQPMLNMHQLVGTFVAIVLFAGFPVVAYLSWYFNFTWDGLEPIPDLESGAPSRFGKRNWLGLTAIVLLSGWLGFVYFNEVKQDLVKQEEGIRQVKSATSIAVLPFRDLSPDQDQAFITEGLTEELTSLLGKVSELNVAAASSTFALAKRDLTPVDIGRRLQVDTIVTGSLRVTGNRLKIRTELIDSGDGMTLWTETFNREFKDIFAVEEEISRSIVNLLEDRYLEAGEVTSAAKTAVTDAYVMYLKGREQYRLQTTEGMKQARKYFEQAIALDPEYALAYVGNADTLLMLEKGSENFGILETDVAIALADNSLAKAITRDSTIAEAYAIMGRSFQMQGNLDEALSAYDKAIGINQSLAKAYLWKYLILSELNRQSEAFESLEYAYSLDPISLAVLHNRAYELSRLGRNEESAILYSQVIKDFPQSPLGYAGLADLHFLQGELAESLSFWRKAFVLSPENEFYQKSYIGTLITLGFVEEAKNLTDDPFYEATFLLAGKRYETLFKVVDEQIASYPDDPWVKFEAAWYQSLVGDRALSSQIFVDAFPLFNEEELYAMPMCSPAIEIAWAFKYSNQIDKSKEILSKCESLYVEAKNSGMQDNFVDHLGARIAALKNQPNAAAQQLKKAIKNGWREWWTGQDPIFSELKTIEEIESLINLIEQKLEEEKEKARLILHSSDKQQPAE
ncbi:tetratricopeptide repeat protein [Aliiglaciecola sp. M165]|uniref:tetratricopeptide repeat protein n=1 Tax=Aliiglaciecola sp. M165 TaxID=2593649 RepID=UPI00117C4087|nr:tetratricopeptide repeat protein [Aliiglaciecola sp. M165]TRY33828.1 tetratricopeptide repeat protein [Aliiglaciecola sp. M165]